ncbi:MAG TPA: HigA family addiction module antitoxin [Dyella sp.]|uniref:HigA family addiction module antitoxin n=1 Tax=Dyella sp. TaxID=1869338 RepID=UPI002C081A3A|nr:HigA family addiction module antitoxin [Dyella sp.]HUB89779.1 HigA family addiction module antitoxin [Dyella sp.]
MARMYNPPHPGELLREYLGSMQVGEAAKRLRVARSTLSRLLNGHASFTAAMALRLADALGTEPEAWLDLQQQYDLWHAARRKRPKIARIPLPGRIDDAAA